MAFRGFLFRYDLDFHIKFMSLSSSDQIEEWFSIVCDFISTNSTLSSLFICLIYYADSFHSTEGLFSNFISSPYASSNYDSAICNWTYFYFSSLCIFAAFFFIFICFTLSFFGIITPKVSPFFWDSFSFFQESLNIFPNSLMIYTRYSASSNSKSSLLRLLFTLLFLTSQSFSMLQILTSK